VARRRDRRVIAAYASKQNGPAPIPWCDMCLLTINQLTTELASDQGVLIFGNFADAESLARWGGLPLVIKYHLDSFAMAAGSLPLSQTAKFLIDSTRVEYFSPLIVGGILSLRYQFFVGDRLRSRPAVFILPICDTRDSIDSLGRNVPLGSTTGICWELAEPSR